MNGNIASVGDSVVSAGVSGNCFSRAMKATADKSLHFFVGLAFLLGLWWLAIYVVTLNPDNSTFSDFAPLAAFQALPDLWEDGTIPHALETTGGRLGTGMFLAIVIGVPIGILMGQKILLGFFGGYFIFWHGAGIYQHGHPAFERKSVGGGVFGFNLGTVGQLKSA